MRKSGDTDFNDPFFFDQDRLQTIAVKEIIGRGLMDCRDNRVMEVDQDQEVLWGRVEGDDPDTPYDVVIRFNEDGFSFTCECSEDIGGGKVCRHVVALLCRYADQAQETDKLLTATDSAIKDRRKRGRTEVEVQSLSGEHWFGSWRASSLGTTSPFPRSFTDQAEL